MSYEKLENPKGKPGEASFTLFETMVAIGLMVSVILHVSSVQGNSVYLSEYGRKVSQASWIAKAIMARIEWGWKFYELKELNRDPKEEPLDQSLCPKEPPYNCDFTYSVSIQKWDLPLIDILTGGLASATKGDTEKTEDGGNQGGISGVIAEQVKTILGDEVLRIANVKVMWSEGARTNDTEITYLLTNQRALDGFIEAQNKPAEPKKQEKVDPNKKQDPNKQGDGAEPGQQGGAGAGAAEAGGELER